MPLRTKSVLYFDLETDGLLPEATRIWTMTLSDGKTYQRFDKLDVGNGLELLRKAEEIIGHNIIAFDIPVIQKLCPGWKPVGKVTDTLVLSRLLCGNIGDSDFQRFKEGTLPGGLIGRHSLEAWGFRLGLLKGEYGKQVGAWDKWTAEMSTYCEQDVRVTVRLYENLMQRVASEESVELEHRVAEILVRQSRKGFLFDRGKADELYSNLLTRRAELLPALREVFPPFFLPDQEFTPKRDNARLGYTAGAPMTKIKEVEFNPGSHAHIARFFQKRYGWEPTEYTEKSGQPKIDDEILVSLPYPEAKLIGEYLMITKRLGQLAEGDKAWLRYIQADGRIHGDVNHCGAITRRMAHYDPNLAQVPASYSPYGKQCRALFRVPANYKLVGIDASGLEARCLGHYLAYYDGGEYAKTVVEGRKEEGTDVHTVNMRALGITDRDTSKTWFYAWCYGAGVTKLAKILGMREEEARKAMVKFTKVIPAFKQLKEAVKSACRRKFLTTLDGGKLPVRSEHSALNTLLQGAGAVIMKKALVLFDEMILAIKEEYGDHAVEFVANVHDEWQLEVLDVDNLPERVGQLGVQAIRNAGVVFRLRCPLDGEFKVGDTWAETH